MKIIARDSEITIGIDASASSLSLCVMRGQEILKGATIRYTHAALKSFLSRFVNCRIRSVYEAGCMGYWLHDTLTELGVENTVTPPSKTPRSQDDRVKTNSRDARKLAQLHQAGALKAIVVPDKLQRATRQLVRTRRQLDGVRKTLMHQIRSLLLMHHLEPPEEVGRVWTQSWMNWVSNEPFNDIEGAQYIRQSLDAMLQCYQALREQVRVLLKQITELSREQLYAHQVTALCIMPGIGVLTAMTVLTEIGSAERFANSEGLTNYLGLTPSEHSTGEQHNRGHISKAGNGAVRAVLTQCAWVWIRRDNAAYTTYRRIARRREKKRAIVAMARRFATRIYWQLRNVEVHSSVSSQA